MEQFDIIKTIGKGSFASVLKLKRKEDNQYYALKRVKILEMSPCDRDHALNEVRLLASFHHPNIIEYKECFYTEESHTLDIVMEYAEKGDLSSTIKEMKKDGLSINENFIWKTFFDICFGLKALHEQKVVHRDLKSANIFLCKDGVAKIGDFNVSKRLKFSPYLLSQTGTPYYASPEIWKEKPYDTRTDIWSLGCIVYEMCTLNVPFKAKTIELLAKNIIKGVYEPIPDFYKKELKNLISLLLCVDMKKRPTITQLLNVSFIKDKLLCLDKKVLNDEKYYNDKLLDTITFPNNVDELNNVLPTIINYKNSNNYDRKIHYVMKVKRKTNSNKIRTSLSVDTKKDNINKKKVLNKKFCIPKVSINLIPIQEVKGDITNLKDSKSTNSNSTENDNLSPKEPSKELGKIYHIKKIKKHLRSCSPINIQINYNRIIRRNPNLNNNILHMKK